MSHRRRPARAGARRVTMAAIGLRGMPGVMGGIEAHCEHLYPRLAAQAGDALHIVVLARAPYVPKGRQEIDGVTQIPLPAPRGTATETIVHSLAALLHARFVLGARLVHLHAVGPGLVAPLARVLGMSLIFTHHGADYRRGKWGRVARTALRLGEWAALRTAHRVIAVSAEGARDLAARFPRRADRIRHIPNGVPPRAPPPPGGQDLPADLGLSPGRFIVSVGRLVPEKGHDTLIAAYRRSGLAPDTALVIVGGADHDSAHARDLLAQAGDGVIFAGNRPRHQVMALLRHAALFVLPSLHEGLSIAALEAIDAGAPVLLSDIPANREFGLPEVNHVAAGSVAALAAALAAPSERYRLAAAPDMSAHDWDRIAAATLAEIRTLPAARRALPAAAERAAGP